jgi:hypothetical protein
MPPGQPQVPVSGEEPQAAGHGGRIQSELAGPTAHGQRHRAGRLKREVDTQQHVRAGVAAAGQLTEQPQLVFALHVEPVHPGSQPGVQLGGALDRSAEGDAGRRADSPHMGQFAAGGHLDAVHPWRQGAQHRSGRVRLGRVVQLDALGQQVAHLPDVCGERVQVEQVRGQLVVVQLGQPGPNRFADHAPAPNGNTSGR